MRTLGLPYQVLSRLMKVGMVHALLGLARHGFDERVFDQEFASRADVGYGIGFGGDGCLRAGALRGEPCGAQHGGG